MNYVEYFSDAVPLLVEQMRRQGVGKLTITIEHGTIAIDLTVPPASAEPTDVDGCVSEKPGQPQCIENGKLAAGEACMHAYGATCTAHMTSITATELMCATQPQQSSDPPRAKPGDAPPRTTPPMKLSELDPREVVGHLLTAMWLYPHYPVASRGPSGLLLDAIRTLMPTVAARLDDGTDVDQVRREFGFSEEDD